MLELYEKVAMTYDVLSPDLKEQSLFVLHSSGFYAIVYQAEEHINYMLFPLVQF